MKDLTIFPLQSYRGKIVGVVLLVISAILMAMTNSIDGFIIIKSFDNSQHLQLFFWLTIFSFYLIAFSKEKMDDERVKKIRSKSLQISFGLLTAIMLSVDFVGIIKPDFSTDMNSNISLFAFIGLLIYLAFFNIALYFDPKWTYNDDTVAINIKKNRIVFLSYMLITIVIIVLIFII